MAFNAVVLPAPFGPMIPRMRPSATRKSTPSSATVVPNVLRRPRASMHAIASALLLFSFRLAAACAIEQFFGGQPEPLNRSLDPGPFFRQELLTLALQQQIARARLNEHSQPPP